MEKPRFHCSECGEAYEKGQLQNHIKVCSHKIVVLRKMTREYKKKLASAEREVSGQPLEAQENFTSSGSKGAFGELLVSADLLKQGFHVFRSVSPNCPCDLIAMDLMGRVSRIEVKTSKPSILEVAGKSDITAVVDSISLDIKYYSSLSNSDGTLEQILESSLR